MTINTFKLSLMGCFILSVMLLPGVNAAEGERFCDKLPRPAYSALTKHSSSSKKNLTSIT